MYGQIVVGPPGSGKSTYCAALQQFYQATGRPVAVINLDPANDSVNYTAAVSVTQLICLEAACLEHGLGPNGGLLFCMDYLCANLDWLRSRLDALAEREKETFLVLDLPGQAELFTHAGSLQRLVETMTRTWGHRLAAVQLIDSHLCLDAGKYLAALLHSLSTILHMELPMVHVLSKVDLLASQEGGGLEMEYCMEGQELWRLAGMLDGSDKYRRLGEKLCEVIEDFSLVNYTTLDVNNKKSMERLVLLVDKCVGWVDVEGQQPFMFNESLLRQASLNDPLEKKPTM